MSEFRRRLLLLCAVGVQFCLTANAYTQLDEANEIKNDKRDDDDKPALARLKARLKKYPPNKTNAIFMFAGDSMKSYAKMSIPVWRAYAEKHGFDFFLQEETLNSGHIDAWSKPRALMEIFPRVQNRWKYVWVVDPVSLPAAFNKSWEYIIQEHMRNKRYANDKVWERLIFCPWDCEKEYKDQISEGACYGALQSGCIMWAKKPKLVTLMKAWYAKRHLEYFAKESAVAKGFEKMKERNYDRIYYKDVQSEIGRSDSKLLATFTYDEKSGHGWDVRKQIHDYIKKTSLGAIANTEEHKRPEL